MLNFSIGKTWDFGAKYYEKLKELKVDGREAVWIRQTIIPNTPASGPAIDHVYIQNGTEVYEISIWVTTEAELEDYIVIFTKILSTFKFLD